MRKPSDNNAEFLAFYDVLKDTPPEAPTACAGWTAHELVAHLTAGAEEMADLVERTLRDAPERPTRGFEEREAPWRAVPDDELRSALLGQGGRLMAALDELYERDPDRTVLFTGCRLTASQLATHCRSESAIHRWDLVGDDDIGAALLAQPVLVEHGRFLLAAMPALTEGARKPQRDDDLLTLWGRRVAAWQPQQQISSPSTPKEILTGRR